MSKALINLTLIRLKKALYFVTVFCFAFASPANSDTLPKDSVIITADTVKEIQKIFQKHGYNTYQDAPNFIIPPLMLQSFPKDLSSIKEEKNRHQFFIQMLAPLVLEANRKISLERKEILKLSQETKLNNKQIEYLEKIAQKYDVFTRLTGQSRIKYQLKELREKVDIVPPSIVIGVSAIETNWGTSRIAPEGNALFKELVWYTNEGLKPQGENDDDTYRIKIYPTLGDAVEAFVLKLNSSVDFADMRDLRKNISKRKKLVEGRTMAHTMLFKSPLENYIGMLDYIITFYNMIAVDKAVLKNVESSKKTGAEK